MPPHILLVNPWIHDFAAYDVWAKPYGLLSLAAILRAHGLNVTYIDCLDRFHPEMKYGDPGARHGRGPYLKTRLPNPRGLENIQRKYSRYGIPPQWFRADLAALPSPPDLILVTSLMTYWYPGVFETISHLKEMFPDTPLILGGIYARLCADHAKKYANADLVATSNGDDLLSLVEAYTGHRTSPLFDLNDPDALPYPAFDLQHKINYVPILTTRGCPFDCAYCASGFLEATLRRRSPQNVIREVLHWHDQYGVADFVLYDDAFLIDAPNHALPILEGIIRSGRKLFFHTPNALHIRSINEQTASAMFHAGFHTLRLGLETAIFENRTRLDRKVNEEEFFQAVNCLKKAGFKSDQIGAYLLVGLPGQSLTAVKQSIQIVKTAGITPIPTHYTPIPHTALWPEALAQSRYDLESDPIFTNNAIFPCQQEEFAWEIISQLKIAASS